MKILTRSRRIRKALQKVLARIPAKDRKVLDSFVTWVKAEREWRIAWMAEVVDPISAGLFPLYDLKTRKDRGSQILFVLPCCRLFSDDALAGIVAHEFAHALRAARLGSHWHDKMQREYQRGERRADSIACAWGFQPYIRKKDIERRTIVNPYIEGRELVIVRRALLRAEEQNATCPGSP